MCSHLQTRVRPGPTQKPAQHVELDIQRLDTSAAHPALLGEIHWGPRNYMYVRLLVYSTGRSGEVERLRALL